MAFSKTRLLFEENLGVLWMATLQKKTNLATFFHTKRILTCHVNPLQKADLEPLKPTFRQLGRHSLFQKEIVQSINKRLHASSQPLTSISCFLLRIQTTGIQKM